MKTIERRTAHKDSDPVRRAWYEHAGAELMALDLGVVIGAIATKLIESWRFVAIIGAVGFVLACCSVWGVATWYRVIIEKARAKRARATLTAVRGDAPITPPPAPVEHRRFMKDGGDVR